MHSTVNRINKGFTLLELMATILIMSLLVAIAVPTYRDYQIRARMTEVVLALESILDAAKEQYVSSSIIPSTVVGLSSGSFTAYTQNECIDYIYYDNSSSWANAGKGAMVQAVISSKCGQGIPGFTTGASGNNNRVTVAFLATGEFLQMYCGSWVDDGTQVPLTYLPSGCQNDAFSTSVTG